MPDAKLDTAFEPVVAAMAGAPPVSSLTPQEARTLWADADMGEAEAVWDVRDMEVPGAAGAIAARFYCPEVPRALILYLHGGGWVLGDLLQHDPAVRAFANRTGAAILSINYRLAPEHPFPAGLDDAYAALNWCLAHRDELVGGAVPLLVAGDSAGGNLAAVLALEARDRGGPPVHGQLLFYPAIDGRCNTPSWRENAHCPLLTSRDMAWYWDHYAGQADRRDPRLSPCEASDHAGLPPAVLAIAGIDPLRDEGLNYADQLARAGNEVTVLRYDNLPHGFFNFAHVSDRAAMAFDEIAAATRRLIAAASDSPIAE
ncbi:MAG TPA: alpha/beta hydrolase [Sphingobium sp.]|nr:alpha/beta hydrolase [Sphingobium sp.]